MGIRPSVCRHIAGGTCPSACTLVGHSCRGLVRWLALAHPQWPDWLPALVLAPEREAGREGTRRDLRGWCSRMWMSVEWKTVKSAGVPWWLCWPLVSSVVKAVAVTCRAAHWELGYSWYMWHLGFTGLWGEGGYFLCCLKGWGSGRSLHSLSASVGNSF